MDTYIVLLRGINVSGQKKIKMADLRKMLEKLKFQDVETYIQSGNILLRSREDGDTVGKRVKDGIAKTFGFDVPTLVKTYGQMKSIFGNNPFTDPFDIENKQIYFAFLKNTPPLELVEKFRQEKFQGEQFTITDDCVYLNYKLGAGKAKISNNLIERKLKVSATSRNYRTTAKLLEMSKR